MKTYHHLTFNQNSEFRLIQRLDRLETSLYQVKRSFIKWGIGLVFILVTLEGLFYRLAHI